MDQRLSVLASCRFLDPTVQGPSVTEKTIDPLIPSAVEKMVVRENHQPCSTKSRDAQLFGKCYGFAETEHLLRILTVARILEFDGVREIIHVLQKNGDIDFPLCERGF
jgi:hypothetical protein